jgi:hypothetical protein
MAAMEIDFSIVPARWESDFFTCPVGQS